MSRWVVDPAHTLVQFSVRHMMISTVRGRFDRFEGHLDGDPSDLSSAKIEAVIDADSVNTGQADRDAHLRSPDFFDAENFPKITFESRRITPAGGNTYDVLGALTIRGVTRELPFRLTFEGAGKDPWGNERAGFSIEGTLNRKDFGLNWNAALEFGGVLVGDEVKITVEVEAIKQAAAA